MPSRSCQAGCGRTQGPESYFGSTERLWQNLQTRYDLEVEGDRLGDRLNEEVTARAS